MKRNQASCCCGVVAGLLLAWSSLVAAGMASADSADWKCCATDSVTRVRADGSPVVAERVAAGTTLYIPAAAHSSGAAGTLWRTDLELHNPGDAAVAVTVALLKRNESNMEPATSQLTLAAGSSQRFEDVLADLFSFSGAAALRLVVSDGEVLASSRTYNDRPDGTYGQLVPAFTAAQAFGDGEPARIVQLSESDSDETGYRTNIGLLNLGSSTLLAELDLYTSDGTLLGSVDQYVSPYEYRQLDRVFRQVTSVTVDDGYAVIAGYEPFLAYASVVDNRTGDPVFLPAMRPPPSGALIIPAAAHVGGAAGTVWRTDMQVHNPGATQCAYTVELLARNQDNSTPASVAFQLAPGRSVRYGDVLDAVFGFEGAAALRITPQGCTVEVTSRTYNATPTGTYGQMVPARAAVTAISDGDSARLIQLEESGSPGTGFRTNIGLVNVTESPIQLTVDLYDATGTHLGTVAAHETALRPLEYRQLDRVFGRVTSSAVSDGYAVVSASTAGGAFLAYASVIDNRTGDPIFVPELVPAGTLAVTRQFVETSYWLLDLEMLSDTVGWAVGDPHWDGVAKAMRSTLLRTSDGGSTWEAQPIGETAPLNAVEFAGTSDGWAVGDEGLILHTADGGASWNRQTVSTSDSLRAVSFVDAQQGWVTAVRAIHWDHWGDADNWRASVWHTSDGGASWVEQHVADDASILHGVQFLDSQTGWAVGARYLGDDPWPEHAVAIYHTRDGGQSWTDQSPGELAITATDIEVVSADHAWVTGFVTNSGESGGATFRTDDGGTTWQRHEPGQFFDLMWDVEALDADRAYVVGANYVGAWGPPVYRTLDGGATWEKVIQERHDSEGIQGLVLTGSRAVGVGDHDILVVSSDPWGEYGWPNGENLFEQSYISTHYKLEDVFFASDMSGWAVGRKTFGPYLWGQVILHTADGGVTWTEQYEQAPRMDSLFSVFRLDAVAFVDEQTGWAVGRSEMVDDGGWEQRGAILHTSDGGATWVDQGQNLEDDLSAEFFDVQFFDANHGWALEKGHYDGASGGMRLFLAETSDGGASWQWVSTGIDASLSVGFETVLGGFHFTDPMHGWAVGGLGEIVHTSDGGQTWTAQQHDAVSPHMLQVTFTDTDTGWIAAERGVFATIDGGATWTRRELGLGGDLHDIQFPKPATGWAVGDWGAVLRTTDAGASWTAVDNSSALSLLGLHCVRSDLCWAVGVCGEIVRIGRP